jgi:hypothetical protein
MSSRWLCILMAIACCGVVLRLVSASQIPACDDALRAGDVDVAFLPVAILTSSRFDAFTAHLVQSMHLAEASALISPTHLARQCSAAASCTLQKSDCADVKHAAPLEIRPCLHIARGDESAFGRYHDALRQKMRFVAATVLHAARSVAAAGSPRAAASRRWLLDAVLFIDSDAQVLPGWLSQLVLPRLGFVAHSTDGGEGSHGVASSAAALIASRRRAAICALGSVDAHRRRARRHLGFSRTAAGTVCGSDTANATQERCRAAFPRALETMYFQREARNPHGPRDKVNTGVMLVSVASAAAVAVFLEANATFTPRKGGDQTAVQRVLRRFVDADRVGELVQRWRAVLPPPLPGGHLAGFSGTGTSQDACSADAIIGLGSRSSAPCVVSAGDDESAVMYDVFDKRVVNAGQTDAQLTSLLVHHAHMSGAHKRDGLLRVFDALVLRERAGADSPALRRFLLDGNVTATCESAMRQSGTSHSAVIATCRAMRVHDHGWETANAPVTTAAPAATAFTEDAPPFIDRMPSASLPRDAMPGDVLFVLGVVVVPVVSILVARCVATASAPTAARAR